MPDQRFPATSSRSEERGWFRPVCEAIQPCQGRIPSQGIGSMADRAGLGVATVMCSDRARLRWRCTALKKAILIVAINGAHCGHGVVDGLAPDHFPEQALEALCCRCGPDRERERDDVFGETVPSSTIGPPSRALSHVESTRSSQP